MKKILITGSQGYLGSVLTDYLNQHNFKIIGYDTGFFKDSLLFPPELTETLLLDARSITEKDIESIDAVVHLAGISNDPVGKLDAALVYDPTRTYSLNIAKICKKLGVKFIFASSCSIYGLGEQDLLTETSTTSPQTFYSLNKLQIETDLQSISDSTFSPIALRFATVFGASPRIRFDVVINMLTGMAVSNQKIVLNSNGLSWRPNLHILDACEAIRCAIELEHNTGKLLVLNVGADNNNLQVIEIAKTIQKNVPNCKLEFLSDNPLLDKEGLIRDRKVKDGRDTRTYKVSFEKIKTVMPDFNCKWDVERGVIDMIELFKAIPLSNQLFKSRGFYRLQQLEFLHASGYISDDLFWIKSKE
jgi:nucleoside-diphosphate-sugar epimerase